MILAGLRRHRHQRGQPGIAQQRHRRGLCAGHPGRLLRRHRHRPIARTAWAWTSWTWAISSSSSWLTSCPKAASCSRSGASTGPRSTSRSARGSTRASRSSRSSRSWAPSTEIGQRRSRSRPLPASCRACPRTSSRWWTRAVTATAPPCPSRRPAGRGRSSSWATARTSWPGGRSRKTRTATRRCPSPSHQVPPRLRSGSPSSCSPAPRTSRTTSSCPTCDGTRTTSRKRWPRWNRGRRYEDVHARRGQAGHRGDQSGCGVLTSDPRRSLRSTRAMDPDREGGVRVALPGRLRRLGAGMTTSMDQVDR